MGFGQNYSDYMMSVDWDHIEGWSKPKIHPYGPLRIPTTATALHYGISVHEGLNIVKNSESGKLQTFRSKDHLDFFQASANHLELPSFNSKEFLKCLGELAKVEKNWIPSHNNEQGSLYARLNHISTDARLGVSIPQ
jgi:branched-chain amino acid aminotransferase